jgi:phage-related protein
MAEDYFKPRGRTKASEPDAGSAVTREVPVFGIVKDNIDPTRSGRLRVYISDLGGDDPDDSDSWSTVSYMTPFYGRTDPSGGDTGYGEFTSNPSSYGMWNSPPDIGSKVICLFVNGDPNYGFWIGCVPEPEALFMVPAIGSSDKVITNEGEAQSYGGATRLPVTNMNSNNTAISDSPTFLNEPKPVHSYVASILSQQGLIRDPIRGTISTSAQRESPSRVGWGVSSPGRPIYEGGFTDETVADEATKSGTGGEGLKVIARRGGHSIVMDDGDLTGADQLIRLRTALGHQILMSDDGQCLHIIHSNGQSWIELGKEGTIDMYSTNSVNIRTQGDLNLHADNNINMHAAKQLNIQAESINMNSEKDTNHKIGTDYSVYTKGKETHKVDAQMSFESGSDASFASKNIAYINGSKVNLNTGATGSVPKTVPPIPIQAHTDTLFDATKGYAAAPGKLLSIVSRAPAHAPWANAGQGVDVKTSTNASSELPSPPSPAVAKTNTAVNGATPATVTAASAATVPPVNAVSTSLDKNTTAAMVSAVAKSAADGPAKLAVSTGAAVIQTANGAVAAIGSLAQTPTQLQNAGILKPGSAALVNSLVQGGANVTSAMTNNLFTGKPGAETLSALVQNTGAQVQAQVELFQKSQTALTTSGVMTGKEAPAAIAGLVLSGSQVGIKATLDTVKNVASSATASISGVTGPITGGVGSATGALNSALSGATGAANSVSSAVAGAMSTGNFAATLATTTTGGLGAIAGALSSAAKSAGDGISGLLDTAKGVAGSAFAAVTSAFKPFKAGVPQNLTAIAEKNAKEFADKAAGIVPTAGAAAGSVAGSVAGSLGQVTNAATGSVTGGLTGALSSVGSAVGSTISGVVSGVTSAISGVTKGLTTAMQGVSSGLSIIPGGQNAVSSVVNNAKGILNSVPGTGAITGLINNVSTAVTNGISAAASLTSSAASLTGVTSLTSVASLTGANSLTGSLTSALSGGLDALKKGATSLSSLALSGLPPGLGSQLSAAMNSLSAGGSLPIKLPTVASNTLDRGELNAQLTSVLGNAKIPMPNFTGGQASASLNLSKKQTEAYEKYDKVKIDLEKAQDEMFDLKKAYYNAKKDLPAGDPGIDTARDALYAKEEQLVAIRKELQTLATTA